MRKCGVILGMLYAILVILPLVCAANGRFNFNHGNRKSHDMRHDQTTQEEPSVNKRVNKPKACPKEDSPFGSCEKSCSGDSDCKDDMKCCSHGPNNCGTQCKEPIKDTPCDIACPKNYDPVCGTDGVTYSTECMLYYTICKTNQNFIKMKAEGQCPTEAPCHKEKKKYTRPMTGQMIPQCDSDGFYKPMQCWGSTGKCWCVTRHGNAIDTPDGIWTPSDEDCLQLLNDVK